MYVRSIVEYSIVIIILVIYELIYLSNTVKLFLRGVRATQFPALWLNDMLGDFWVSCHKMTFHDGVKSFEWIRHSSVRSVKRIKYPVS